MLSCLLCGQGTHLQMTLLKPPPPNLKVLTIIKTQGRWHIAVILLSSSCLSKSPCLAGNFKQLFRVTYTFKKSKLYPTICYIETSQSLRVPAFVNSFNESSTTDQGSMQRDKSHIAAFYIYWAWIATYVYPLDW